MRDHEVRADSCYIKYTRHVMRPCVSRDGFRIQGFFNISISRILLPVVVIM